MSCFNGTKFKERQVSFKGDPKKGIPSSIDYISNIAQKMADLEQVNYIVYERQLANKGSFYDFQPQIMGKKEYTKLIRFNKSVASGDILQNSGDKQPKSSKPEKKKGKDKKVK